MRHKSFIPKSHFLSQPGSAVRQALVLDQTHFRRDEGKRIHDIVNFAKINWASPML
jgi:hypothetical protein